MKKDSGGYILLYRSLQRNRLWPKRKFTPLEAWLDLLLMANFTKEGEWWYDDKDYKKIWLNYGEMVASRRYLAKRWEWKLSTVQKRLGVWKGEQMIEHRSKQGENIILIVNFAKYQVREKEEVNTKVNSRVNRNETGLKQMLNKTKEVSNKVSKEVINNTTLGTPIQNIVDYFFLLKKWDKLKKEDYAKRKIVYARYVKPAKELLELCDSDIEEAKLCLKRVADWANSRNLDWSIETVFKKWEDIDKLKAKEKQPTYQGQKMKQQANRWYVLSPNGDWKEFMGKWEEVQNA